MPRTLGDSFLHVDRIAPLVPVDDPLPELRAEPLDEIYREIGRNVASPDPRRRHAPDGHRRDPGRRPRLPRRPARPGHPHRDALRRRHAPGRGRAWSTAGGRRLLPGKIVTSFIMGTRRALRVGPTTTRPSRCGRASFTNDPFQIARNDQMIAINSALAVDLTGQVAADTVHGQLFLGHRRPGRLRPRRGAQPGRQADHRPPLDGQGRAR